MTNYLSSRTYLGIKFKYDGHTINSNVGHNIVYGGYAYDKEDKKRLILCVEDHTTYDTHDQYLHIENILNMKKEIIDIIRLHWTSDFTSIDCRYDISHTNIHVHRRFDESTYQNEINFICNLIEYDSQYYIFDNTGVQKSRYYNNIYITDNLKLKSIIIEHVDPSIELTNKRYPINKIKNAPYKIQYAVYVERQSVDDHDRKIYAITVINKYDYMQCFGFDAIIIDDSAGMYNWTFAPKSYNKIKCYYSAYDIEKILFDLRSYPAFFGTIDQSHRKMLSDYLYINILIEYIHYLCCEYSLPPELILSILMYM